MDQDTKSHVVDENEQVDPRLKWNDEPVNSQPTMMKGPEDSSATIEKLSAALSKAQGEIGHALKDAENPHFKSTYATLASVLDACRLPLSKNELAVFQKIQGEPPQKMTIVTILSHSSGEWMKSTLPLILNKADMQGLGSAISYGRRYALSAMVGVAQDDDDGNAAGAEKQNKGGQQKGKAQDKSAPAQHQKAPAKPPMSPLDRKLLETMSQAGWTGEQCKKYGELAYNIKAGEKMPDKTKEEFIKVMETHDPESAFQHLEMSREPDDLPPETAPESKGKRVIKNHAPASSQKD